jgi:hypothetical protein
MLTLLLTSVMIALAGPQDGAIAPDRASYQELVKCAGVHRASIVEALTLDPEASVEGDATLVTGFQHLAYLYGAPLGLERTEVDTAIGEASERAIHPFLIARTQGGIRVARQGLEMDRRICAVILQRVSGTS